MFITIEHIMADSVFTVTVAGRSALTGISLATVGEGDPRDPEEQAVAKARSDRSKKRQIDAELPPREAHTVAQQEALRLSVDA